MARKILNFLEKESTHLQDAGLFHREFSIQSASDEKVVVGNRKIINLASNNYLGFANHPALKEAAQLAIEKYGLSLSASRTLAGTQILHTRLERALSSFLHTDDTVLFGSGYHANTGVFECLFNDKDYIFCDALCHPSLADGIRLSRARVLLYRHSDMNHLEDRLKRSRSARFRVIVTDGVFSLNGQLADLPRIHQLAERYDALIVVGDGQGVGVLGEKGRGIYEHFDFLSQADVITGTLNKALSCGAGGFVSGRHQIITWLRQKSRPYMMSSALSSTSTGACLRALDILQGDQYVIKQLHDNIVWFRNSLSQKGFNILGQAHPILVVMLKDAVTTQKMVNMLHLRDIYAVGFCYPVVPKGQARVRVQISAILSEKSLQRAARMFETVGRELRII